MALNQNFTVKNSINTLGSYLSGGVDISTIFVKSGGGTGTTGTGNLVYSNTPVLTSPYIAGHPTVEGVTSTGATGTGKFVFDTAPTISGHPTIEGVTSTGATGTGKFVFDTSPTISAPTISGHPTIEGVTSTGATGTGKFVFDTAPTISGHPTIEGVTSTGATGTGNLVYSNTPVLTSPYIAGHPTIEGVTSTGATGTGKLVFDSAPTISGDLRVTGNLYIAGSSISVNQNELIISDPIIYLNEGANFSAANAQDIGIAANYYSGSPATYAHTGLIRDRMSGTGANGTAPYNWYLFSNMTTEPSGNNINSIYTGNGLTIDTLVANVSGTLTGNATSATQLRTAQNIGITSGPITAANVSFNGLNAVALTSVLTNNSVNYGNIQKSVASGPVVLGTTAATTNYSEIPASTVGYQLLSATNAANAATAIGLGTTNSPQFSTVSVTNGTQIVKDQIFTGSSGGSNIFTVSTFLTSANLYTVKFISHLKQTGSTAVGARATNEILVTYNAYTSTWDGTYYAIVDTSGIFNSVDVGVTNGVLTLTYTMSGNTTYIANVYATAITD